MNADAPTVETTVDAVLGGRIRLRQPKRGHRVGHDAILLAAATDARPGEQVADFGAGVGGVGLALAARVPQINATLIEIDPQLCALAVENAERNGMANRVKGLVLDVEDKHALASAGLLAGSMDCVLMNPPFNDARRQKASPDPARRLAHVAAPELLSRWIASAAYLLKPLGVLTLIWRADALDDVIAALKPDFGTIAVLPVYPCAGASPIRVLVRAEKGAPGDVTTVAGLFLNNEQGKPTDAVEAVLRGGAPLRFNPSSDILS
jgi:tRNA1(Val) A37 N6-methylase TrmN6